VVESGTVLLVDVVVGRLDPVHADRATAVAAIALAMRRLEVTVRHSTPLAGNAQGEKARCRYTSRMRPETSATAAVVAADSRLETEWDELAVLTGAAPFSRPAWVRAWAAAFGRETRVATVRRAGALAAALPVVVGRRSITTAADWHFPEMEAVWSDAEALDELSLALVTGRRRATVDFVPAGSATAAAFVEALGLSGFRLRARPRLVSPFIDFGDGWEAFVDSLSTKKWRELRRRRRRLEEEGEVEFDTSDGQADLDRLLSEGFAVEDSGWKADQGTAIASDRGVERFYREVACWAANEGMARVSFLRVGGKAIAFDLSFVDGGSEWLLKTGFNRAWARYSPGTLLRAEALRTAFDDKVQRYEFAGAAEPWKLEWTSATREILVLDGFAPGVMGAVALQASRVSRRLRALRSRLRS